MKINRAEFLKGVEAVLPGLSSRDIIEQSSCIVFKDKKMITYNDEIACSYDSVIDKTMAIKATPLVSILRKLKEDELEVEVVEGEFVIKGKRKQAAIRMSTEIFLPVDAIEKPEKWKKLPEGFTEAIKLVQNCASKDDSQFVLTCIHIHPNWIESMDNTQAGRFTLDTNFKEPILIRRDSIKNIISFDMTDFSTTANWIHFRNPAGLVLSCRRYMEEYPDLTPILKVSGDKVSFPKGIAEAVEKAEVFSTENVNDNLVLIRIDDGKLKIEGEGVSGKYKEFKNIKYKGPKIAFRISPSLLIDLVQRHNECELTEDRLKIEIGNLIYVSVLEKTQKSAK